MRRATLGRLVQHLRIWVLGFAVLLYVAPAAAVSVTALTYDTGKDQLVLTIAYRGTNPDHEFKVQWDACKKLDDERMQILGLLVDNQPDDLARQEFTKPMRIDLRDFSCRPAKVTIRTSAGFFTSVDIPAAKTRGSSPALSSEPRNAP
ncbi:hypothetical protein GCM10011487_51080 [Steroidobacter agaridevorans]|uniref:Uncharacterized protein n=1 Tax=Steroidobacter agaridevorans TaxID=2695856 RepID=A0A829YJY5_9GAMM|nr:hypothetical protein [Steroidobacter agaridevorans]GFE83108.1 hypothetical protein GCM10011487_51080 [Steroidobacter agaridevorans]